MTAIRQAMGGDVLVAKIWRNVVPPKGRIYGVADFAGEASYKTIVVLKRNYACTRSALCILWEVS